MAKLTKNEANFLKLLNEHTTPVSRPITRSEICRIMGIRFASKFDTKARASCRKRGFAEFRGGVLGDSYAPIGWRITAAGRRALAEER